MKKILGVVITLAAAIALLRVIFALVRKCSHHGFFKSYNEGV